MTDESIIRIGKVSSTDPTTATVKVVFADIDNMVTADLPILFPQGIKNKVYAMPDIGDNVLCLFLKQGVGDGFCIGCFYTETEAPPVTEQDKVHYYFEDGTYLEYDRKEHKLTADVQGDADIKVKNVKVQAENVESVSNSIMATTKEATIQATNVNLNCTSLTIKSSSDILIQSATKVTIKGKEESQVVS